MKDWDDLTPEDITVIDTDGYSHTVSFVHVYNGKLCVEIEGQND